MGRCHFVQPDVVRIHLVDVQRRALKELVDVGVVEKGKTRKATAEEVSRAQAALAAAEEDGDWIDIKKELNVGEQRRAFGKLVKEMHFNEKAVIDPEQIGRSKVVEYLVGWSFTDFAGKPAPVSESALNGLSPATYGVIELAIDKHEEAVNAATDLRKNGKGDEHKSPPTLSSVA